MRSGRSTTELHPRVTEGDCKTWFVHWQCLFAQNTFSAQGGIMARNSVMNVIKNLRSPCHGQKIDLAYTLSVGRIR